MKKFVEKNRILPPLFFFISGIILSDFTENQWLILIIVSPLLGIISLSRFTVLKSSLLLPIGFLLITPDSIIENNITDYKGIKLDAEGIVSKSLERTSEYTKIYLDVERIKVEDRYIPANGGIIIYSHDPLYGLYRGHRIRVLNTKLYEFKVYNNPGIFNIRKYYNRKGIYLKGYIRTENDIISFGKSQSGVSIIIYVDKLRENFGRYIRTNATSPSSEIFTALTTGEKKGIPTEIQERFSSLGIAHIIVISGLHVGAVALIFYLLIDWLLKRSEYLLLKYNVQRLTAGLTIIPVLFYMMVAGLATPVLRASIMAVTFLLSIIIGRLHNKLNTLGVAAFIILMIDPTAIFDLSFQLSFISVAGILLANHIFPFSFSSLNDKIITSVKCTTAATIFTSPLVINAFGTLPALSIPSNLIFIPVVEFIIVPLCLLSFLSYNISMTVTDLLIFLNTHLIEIFINCVNYLSELRVSSFTVPYLNKTSFIFLYITILLTAFIKVNRKIAYAAGFSLLLFIMLLTTRDRPGQFEIIFPDAGNRISSLIKLPNGKIVLINGKSGGPIQDGYIERSIISKYLLHSGISKIDHIILLTGEKDLLQGTAFLISKFNVDFLFTNGSKLSGALWESIYKNDIQKIDLISEGEPLLIGNIKLIFYINKVENSEYNKIIVRIIYKDHSIIIGDMSNADLNIISANKNIISNDVDLAYIPNLGTHKTTAHMIDEFKPKHLVTRNLSSKLKSYLLFLSPGLSIHETEKKGLISVTFDQDVIVTSPYR